MIQTLIITLMLASVGCGSDPSLSSNEKDLLGIWVADYHDPSEGFKKETLVLFDDRTFDWFIEFTERLDFERHLVNVTARGKWKVKGVRLTLNSEETTSTEQRIFSLSQGELEFSFSMPNRDRLVLAKGSGLLVTYAKRERRAKK